MSSRIALALLALIALVPTRPVGAVDGVIEVNQAKALTGGINGSLIDDPAGFPVTITQPGSYRLTGNLIVADGNTTALSIGTSNVTVDLSGFMIRGPNSVSDTPACSAGGSGIGIFALGEAMVVRNGRVGGMGSHGVTIGTGRIEGVIAEHNCGIGLQVGPGSAVVDSIAHRNRNQGVLLGESSLVKDSVAYDNMQNGVIASNGTAVLDCVISRNRAVGSVLSPAAGLGHTTYYNNSGGASAGGNYLDCNLADGVTSCPSHP